MYSCQQKDSEKSSDENHLFRNIFKVKTLKTVLMRKIMSTNIPFIAFIERPHQNILIVNAVQNYWHFFPRSIDFTKETV